MFRFFFFGFFGLGRIGWLPKPFLVVGQVEEGGPRGMNPRTRHKIRVKWGSQFVRTVSHLLFTVSFLNILVFLL